MIDKKTVPLKDKAIFNKKSKIFSQGSGMKKIMD